MYEAFLYITPPTPEKNHVNYEATLYSIKAVNRQDICSSNERLIPTETIK